ncbi:MAG: hypothetical protein K2K13_03415 [Clostridiales bacterium]|nr:hypothetical protein [Clostridiales bacterium]
MKDKTAMIIAIIALVFMAVFVVSLTISLAGVYSNIFTYVAIGGGAVALALFMLIKISGRGYSVTQINNEIEMEKIRKENEAQLAAEQAEKEKADTPEDEKTEQSNAELRMQNAELENKDEK